MPGPELCLLPGSRGLRLPAATDQSLWILELQAEGGKRMMAADYLRGHPMDTEK
ncbi:MAG: hypothetical protein ACLUNQ_04735 [Oscillospiraceae bacterium]